jgi:hypothetical protein
MQPLGALAAAPGPEIQARLPHRSHRRVGEALALLEVSLG